MKRRRLTPIQNGRAAQNVAAVCRELLDTRVATGSSARFAAAPALAPERS
jgi:hypothetical protein